MSRLEFRICIIPALLRDVDTFLRGNKFFTRLTLPCHPGPSFFECGSCPLKICFGLSCKGQLSFDNLACLFHSFLRPSKIFFRLFFSFLRPSKIFFRLFFSFLRPRKIFFRLFPLLDKGDIFRAEEMKLDQILDRGNLPKHPHDFRVSQTNLFHVKNRCKSQSCESQTAFIIPESIRILRHFFIQNTFDIVETKPVFVGRRDVLQEKVINFFETNHMR
ncbi:MAG: hypothetical protein BWY44_00793 [Candidatus Omnitrophica bacterium ADurb.Bin292]|nr:MAG: hypothetical protein BWY44_00793 [Candidatus Omnitrophica bacterium ADurb.Bin292]